MTPQEFIEQHIAEAEAVFKHSMLHDRFLLRNGREFFPRRRIGRRATAKACFQNAYRFVMSHPEATYVEGYVFSKIPMIHHAWVTISGDDAMDPTLNSNECRYFGVAFTKEQVEKYTTMSGRYDLFGPAWQTGLYADIDPEFMEMFDLNNRLIPPSPPAPP